jgi:predicted phosphate transport protein (TIGR00153 family)
MAHTCSGAIRREIDRSGLLPDDAGRKRRRAVRNQVRRRLVEPAAHQREARMLAWFQALMPKEDRFFELFERHSLTLVAGAEALRRLLEGGGAAVAEHCREVIEREHEADEITREVLLAVRRSFITPFDRGDIKDLITAMDNAIDQMQQAAKTITIYEVRTFEPPMQAIGGVIVTAAQLTREAVPLLRSIGRHASRLNAITEEITRIEGEADDLHDEGLKALFHAQADANPMAFVIGSEIYGRLEMVVDRFDDVANEISSLVIEHV